MIRQSLSRPAFLRRLGNGVAGAMGIAMIAQSLAADGAAAAFGAAG